MTLRYRVALATAAAAALTGGLLSVTAGEASALAKGAFADFNNDGYADVAYSAGYATVNGHAGAGQIVVMYGTASGLTSTKRQTISQDTPGVSGAAETNDGFGWSSAIGDFDNDGYDDLAVAAEREKLGTDVSAGMVNIFRGSPTGLTGGGTLTDPAPSGHDNWGRSLAAGDFDGDGRDDLAVGSDNARTYVFAANLTSRYTIQPPIDSGKTSEGQVLGTLSMHAGDVTGDGRDDLVVDGYDSHTDQGWNANFYFAGTASGLGGSWTQLTSGIMTGIDDVNNDGYGDIVTGIQWDKTVPYSGLGGKVVVRFGSPSGPAGKQVLTQDTAGVPGVSETGDGFGTEVTLGDINKDGYADLAIGTPWENLTNSAGTSIVNSGSVTVVYGGPSGLNTASGIQYFEQNTSGVPSVGEKDDEFGSEVKLADVTGDGAADLTIGSFGENGYNGALTVLKSTGTKLTTTGAAIFGPSNVGVSTAGSPVFGGNAAN
ncbi:FG-GAP repeat protein [Streptomyces sp. NPDC051940]|uniref:FG-GAP and VCBS repeat-containing protein n=1 Tax=Streptomyces sp. NPDC051940 TaxID=3155675 RepID=UPI0034244FCD